MCSFSLIIGFIEVLWHLWSQDSESLALKIQLGIENKILTNKGNIRLKTLELEKVVTLKNKNRH